MNGDSNAMIEWKIGNPQLFQKLLHHFSKVDGDFKTSVSKIVQSMGEKFSTL